MKTFTHCPVCHQLMIERETITSSSWNKICPANHCAYRVDLQSDIINCLTLHWDDTTKNIFWYSPPRKELIVCFPFEMVYLPWFEPDLSDIDKLLNKLQTLITFS